MQAMNGLTQREIARLKRQLDKEANDVRKLLQDEFNRRTIAQEVGVAYREGVDCEPANGGFTEHAFPLVAGCISTRDAIENSLEAIRKGTYGSCDVCGKHIGAKRLLSVPTATKCLRCETAASPPARSCAPPGR